MMDFIHAHLGLVWLVAIEAILLISFFRPFPHRTLSKDDPRYDD